MTYPKSKCIEAVSDKDFAEDQTTDVTLEECTELAFENYGIHKTLAFHHRLADAATNTKSVCQLCRPDATGAYSDSIVEKGAAGAGFSLYVMSVNYPATIQSWDKLSCQSQCKATEYMLNNVCTAKPKCVNKNHYRDAETGDCNTCPNGEQPNQSAGELCVPTPIITFKVDHKCNNKITMGPETGA